MKAILIAVLLFAPVAAVTPGLMRREHETLEDGVLIEQNAQDAQATKCDSTSDANCCFTQRGVDMAAAVGRKGIAVGQCAAGAKGIAGDKWKDLLDQGLEVCTGNECKDNSDVPVEGTCSAFSCPKGFVRRDDFRPAAPCTDATICKLNCCDIDFSEIGDRQGGLLTMAILTALQNVSRFASLLNPMSPRGDGKNLPVNKIPDRVILLENAAGLYRIMGKVLTPAAKKELCSDGDYTSVRRCIHYAVCVLEHNIDTSVTKVDVETYSLLMEYYTRFETLQWDQLIQELGDDDGGYSKEELECVGLSRFLQSFGPKSASFIEKVNTESAVYHVSSVLLDASKTTHALLDAHRANSSLNATFEALRQAWELPCKLLNCDPTNYWDLLGASHSHSLALFESGASAQHMQAHIKARQRLDFRMVQFLAQHGKQGAEVIDKIYRLEGSVAESRMHRYGAVVTDSLKRVIVNYPKNYGVLDDTLVTLLDQTNAGKFFKTPYQKRLLKALSQKNLMFVGSEQEMAQLRERAAFADDEELDPEDEHLESLVRVVIWGKMWDYAVQSVGKAIKAIGKWFGEAWNKFEDWVTTVAGHIAAGLKAFIDWIASLFECMAFGVVRNLGYGEKYPENTKTIGIKFAFSATLAASLTDLFNNGVINGKVGFAMAVTIGFMPDVDASDFVDPKFDFLPKNTKWWQSMMGFGIVIGLSLSGGIWCGVVGGPSHECYLEISLGLCAVYTKPAPHGHPKCVLFEIIGELLNWGHCGVSVGIVWRLLCCWINFVGGSENCGNGKAIEDRFEIEDVPDGCIEAYDGRGNDYAGCQTHTESGRLCQKWVSQSPHKHNIVSRRNDADATIPVSEQHWDHNFCRNPTDAYKIWCYTTDSKKKWEYCRPLANGGHRLLYAGDWNTINEDHTREMGDAINGDRLGYNGNTINPHRKGALCEGDCDYDGQCGGQMRCYFRTGLTRIPGCIAGGHTDVENADYCINPNSLDVPPTFPNKGFRRRMRDCKGDCDNNGDCASKKCYQRGILGINAWGRVPGCTSGGDEDLEDYDYCFPGGWLNLIYGGRRSPVAGIQNCQGDCNSDDECEGNLRCKQRFSGEAVQGCPAGGKGETKATDYCYSRVALDAAGGTKGYRRRFKNCYGDCDNNGDCLSGRCQQRNHVKETIPGCESFGAGDLPTYDYCTNEFLIYVSINGFRRRMKKCMGHCNRDDDCASKVCFVRRPGVGSQGPSTRVPGCGHGQDADKWGKNYCVGGPATSPSELPWAPRRRNRGRRGARRWR